MSAIKLNEANDEIYKKVFWRLLPFLIACYFIAGLDRTNVAFAKFQFQDALGFSEAVYGLGAGIFTLGYLLFEIPSNMLLKRIGIRKTLLRIMTAWGIFCVCLAFMKTELHFYTLRFLIGVAEAGFFPGVLYYLSKWAPPQKRAQVMAIFMASLGITGALAGPIAGVIMTYMDGVAGLGGWQWLFILEGFPAVILGLVAYFYLDESPRDAKWLSQNELAKIEADLSQTSAAPVDQSPERASLVSSFFNQRFIGLLFACFALMAGTSAYFFWIPTIFKSIGVQTMMGIGLYSSGPFIAAIFTQFYVARRSDKKSERYFHIAGGLLVAAVCWLIMAVSNPGPLSAVLLLTLIVAGTSASYGPFWSVPANILPSEHRAFGIAVITTLGGLASLVQPVVAGMIIDMTGDVNKSLYFNAVFVAVCTIVFLVLCNNESLSANNSNQ